MTRPSWLCVACMIALAVEPALTASAAAGVGDDAAADGDTNSTPHERISIGHYSALKGIGTAKDNEYTHNADLMKMVSVPIFLSVFAIMLMEVFGIVIPIIRQHRCYVGHVPKGLKAVTFTWHPGEEHVPQVDEYFSHAVMLTENNATKGHEATVTVSSYNRISREQAGTVGVMIFNGPKWGTDLGGILPEDALLVAFNCKQFDETTEEGEVLMKSLNHAIENVGEFDKGRSAFQPITFTYLVPKDTYQYAVDSRIQPLTDEEARNVGGEHNILYVKPKKDTNYLHPSHGLRDFFDRLTVMMRQKSVDEKTFTSNIQGRESLHIRKYMRQDFLHGLVVFALMLIGMLSPTRALFSDNVRFTIGQPTASTKLMMMTADLLQLPCFMAVVCTIYAFVQDRITDAYPNPQFIHGLYMTLILVLSVMGPVMLYQKTQILVRYQHHVNRHVFNYMLHHVNTILALLLLSNNFSDFLNEYFGTEVPSILSAGTAELVMGAMFVLETTADAIEGTRDLYGMGDQCDLNALRRFFEEDSVSVTGINKQFSIECTEDPPCDDSACPSESSAMCGVSSDKISIAWGRLTRDVVCTSAKPDQDRKEISDQGSCIVTCTTDYGSHQTVVKCMPAGVAGGKWSYEFMSHGRLHPCYTAEAHPRVSSTTAIYPFPSDTAARINLNQAPVISPDSGSGKEEIAGLKAQLAADEATIVTEKAELSAAVASIQELKDQIQEIRSHSH